MSPAIQTPEWVKDAVFYQIFPDRFARSTRVEKISNLESWDMPPTVYGFKGGDLLGVAEHLDYIADLGINAIYFNPVFQSASNHRYHTHDYYQVDPILGGNNALRELLDAAHARNIRIILDGVFNHASRGFFQFNHLLECGEQSPYLDWFTVKSFPLNAYVYDGKPNYGAWWDLHALPEFNTANPQVREYIFDIAAHWIKFGIDGWRLDVPYEIDDDDFWREFRRRVKGANPDAYIVGEIWHESERWMQGDQFDAVMNYIQTRACIGFFGAESLSPLHPGGGYEQIKPLNAINFAAEIERMLQDPRAEAFIDNFTGQWLTLRGLEAHEPNRKTYPDYDLSLKADMIGETKRLFATLLENNQPVAELLTANYTFTTPRLAEHYNLPAPAGEGRFVRAALPAGRLGLLGHASVLTATSHPNRTSPVKRGKWVLEQLLCSAPPPPPPAVEGLPNENQEQASLRERMEQHRADPVCAGCHKIMDPIGFGLEHYDGTGRWRDLDGAHEIDATGTLPDGRTFDGGVELAHLISTDPRFPQCVTRQMLTYALGREPNLLLANQLAANWSERGAGLRDLVLMIATSDAFRNHQPQTTGTPLTP